MQAETTDKMSWLQKLTHPYRRQALAAFTRFLRACSEMGGGSLFSSRLPKLVLDVC